MLESAAAVRRTRSVSAFRENLTDHLAYADNSCPFQKQRQLHGAIATMPRAYCSSQDAIALSRDFGGIGFAGARSRSIAPLTPNCILPVLSCFSVLIAFVNLSRLVKFPSFAVRASHRKLARQIYRIQHGNFAATRRTAHVNVRPDIFPVGRHDCLLSSRRGLSGCSLHDFDETPQLLVDLPEPVRDKFRRIGGTFFRTRHLLVAKLGDEGAGE